jgi:PTS system mannose-specific IIB component
MPIVMVRVDDRLVHGQILEAWLPCTGAQELLIPNDSLAGDSMQQAILEAAVPCSTRLVIDTVERIALALRRAHLEDLKRMVLVERPSDALRLKRFGVAFAHLNVGNLRTSQGPFALSRSVCIGERCLGNLFQLLREGVAVSLQSVPFENPVDLMAACRLLDPCVLERVEQVSLSG